MTIKKSLHWDITKNCNLRCKHCYNADKYFNKESKDYIPNEMTREQCISAVEAFAAEGFEHIHLLGGEPLASSNIFDVIKRAKELGMIVTINSNACLLNQSIQKKLIDLGVDQFAASLDGCSSQINDSIRGEGTFDNVIRNMKQLNEYKKETKSSMETALVFTLTKRNIEDLSKLPALAKDMNVDLIVLTTFIESGQGKRNRDEFQIEFYDLCDAIELMVASELQNYRIPIQIDMRPRFCEYLSLMYNMPIIYNTKNSLCCAGEEMWYLEANGDVHPCLIFQLDSGKKALNNGTYIKESLNINTSKIFDIKHSIYWDTFIKAKHNFETVKIPTCKDCQYLGICQPCFLDYGEYNLPIMECEWTKAKEKKVYKKISQKMVKINSQVGFDYVTKTIYKSKDPLLSLDSEISCYIWESLVAGINIKSILEYLLKQYDVDINELEYDVASFLLKLREYEIISLEDSNNMFYQKKENLICEQIDDEVIVFDAEKENFFEFDKVGSFIWQNIKNTRLEDIVELICKEYKVDVDTATNDVSTFVNELVCQKLVYYTTE